MRACCFFLRVSVSKTTPLGLDRRFPNHSHLTEKLLTEDYIRQSLGVTKVLSCCLLDAVLGGQSQIEVTVLL